MAVILVSLGWLLLLMLAVAASASHGRDLGGDQEAIAWLARLRSPSGKRFFQSPDSVWELSEAMERSVPPDRR
jgi:mevalonate pyrophosphate decarboxylase